MNTFLLVLKRLTAAYGRLLSWLLATSVAILIIPVSLQIFSRYTDLIPSYIWTEEMARFLFIWMIMIGAMVGIRDGAHFDVDLWPELPLWLIHVAWPLTGLTWLLFQGEHMINAVKVLTGDEAVPV